MKGYPVADFCSARSRTSQPPQWCIFAPPLTEKQANDPGGYRNKIDQPIKAK
jgi:hypothetical protein